MPLETWLAFVAASALLLASPGPTVLLVTSYAVAHGRGVALRVAAGVAVGDLAAMTVALAGLGALLVASAAAFTAVKLAGAAYLVWLGIRTLRGAAASAVDTDASGPPLFWHAAAVTALNPKSIGFFVAFVPQFLRSDAPIGPQAAVLVVTFVLLAALNALAYALLADRLRTRLSGARARRLLARAGGATLIAMGCLAAARRAPA